LYQRTQFLAAYARRVGNLKPEKRQKAELALFRKNQDALQSPVPNRIADQIQICTNEPTNHPKTELALFRKNQYAAQSPAPKNQIPICTNEPTGHPKTKPAPLRNPPPHLSETNLTLNPTLR
jgi:hypothetical protein